MNDELPAPLVSRLRGWRYMTRRLLSFYARRSVMRCGFYERAFRRKIGHRPNYDNPRTFTEKLAWMRLYDHNPLYTRLADKIAVRDYVRERVGGEVLVPCYGIWDKPGDIDPDALPGSFVLKCNHESGFVVLCKDKNRLDWIYTRAQLATRLRMNHYYRYYEWPYLNIKPRIMAEELLVGDDGGEPHDYKIHCYGAKPGYIVTVVGRHGNQARGYYSPEWEPMPFVGTLAPATEVPRPANLERMVEIAAALAEGLRYCRVDFYAVGEKVYFGEITLIPAAGMLKYIPPEYDLYWGERLQLPPRGERQ